MRTSRPTAANLAELIGQVRWGEALPFLLRQLFLQPVDEQPGDAPPADQPAETPPAQTPAVESPPAGETPTGTDDLDAELLKQAQAEADAAEASGEVIVVTGSAIERTETTTAAPVTVLDRQELEASGMVSIGDVLQDLPAQSNAINTQANNGGDGATRVDIRGLGATRTLVLVNGRRHVAGGTGADSSVDLNSIPLAVIERIEVLKDGASAVYGSDAIGGVVNVITRDDFEGAEANLYTGTTQHGGGTTYDMSFIVGQNTGKGNVVFAAGFYDQGDVFSGERGFADPYRDVDWACIQAGGSDKECEFPTGSVATPEGTIFQYVCAEGQVPTPEDPCILPADAICPSGICFNDGGTWRDFELTGNSDTGSGDFYNFAPVNYLLTPQRRYNVWSSGNHRLHENVRAFYEASYVNRKSDQQLAPEPLFTLDEGAVISPDSIYNPFGIPLDDVGKRFPVPRTTFQDINTFRLVTGLDGRVPGELFEAWKWEASYNFGRTVGTVINRGNLIRPNVVEALGPSYIDADGNPQCGSEAAPGSDGCVPLDILSGPDSITPEMIDFLTYDGVATGFNKQHTALGLVRGQLFKTPWNGDVVLAVGGDYRHEAGGYQPDPLTSTGDTTGNKVEPTRGSYQVYEGFSELSIVPVANQDWAKWLEVSLAGRIVDYSTFGNNFSWKTGVLYKSPPGVSLRGTVSTAFRAPSVAELYSGTFDDFPNASDPCSGAIGGGPTGIVAANCAADGINSNDPSTQLRARAGGNRDLDPETARSFTAGVVYEPPFAEGLRLTLDYFRIKIDNAIQRAGANILLSNCYAQEDRQDCDKITRANNGTGQILSIDDRETNIGNTQTSGVDASAGYTYKVGKAGWLRHDVEGAYLLRYNSTIGNITTHGRGVYDLGVFPRFKANLSTMWGLKGTGAGVNLRYIGGFRECEADDCSSSGNPHRRVSANVTGDLYASYALDNPTGKTTVTAGVNNVLDQDPPTIYNGFAATSDTNTYDFLGRYFYVRMTQAF